ncbi:unnamed protein product [Litomosoides sigmodontis]|uniref:Uncharacterized protein n=1 Tax=Litomosoides sigmodontis TaxID=42156 RepID=A0A3P6SRW2_LITSI|nr:unnamed protein product [Litomosoides sigmodontis]VDK79130.1 unnamed protein product [Litomosoides sigmodontis]
MLKILVAILEVVIVYIEGRNSIAYVLVPLSSEAATRMGIKSNDSEMYIPCTKCFFKFNQSLDRLIQYYDRPVFGGKLEPCGCLEVMEKVFTNLKKPALITVSQNIIEIDTRLYYGVMKTERCRLDSMKSVRTVDGLQLALLVRCS